MKTVTVAILFVLGVTIYPIFCGAQDEAFTASLEATYMEVQCKIGSGIAQPPIRDRLVNEMAKQMPFLVYLLWIDEGGQAKYMIAFRVSPVTSAQQNHNTEAQRGKFLEHCPALKSTKMENFSLVTNLAYENIIQNSVANVTFHGILSSNTWNVDGIIYIFYKKTASGQPYPASFGAVYDTLLLATEKAIKITGGDESLCYWNQLENREADPLFVWLQNKEVHKMQVVFFSQGVVCRCIELDFSYYEGAATILETPAWNNFLQICKSLGKIENCTFKILFTVDNQRHTVKNFDFVPMESVHLAGLEKISCSTLITVQSLRIDASVYFSSRWALSRIQ